MIVPWPPVLYDTAQILESTEDAAHRIDRVLDLVCQIVPCRRCALLEAAPIVVRRLSVRPELSGSERSILAQRLTDLLDLLVAERVPLPVREAPGVGQQVHLAVPLISLGDVRGILWVESPAGTTYDEGHLGRLSILAVQLGAYLTIVGRHEEEMRAMSLARRAAELLERMRDPYLEIDAAFRCVAINASAEQLLGAARIDVIGCDAGGVIRERFGEAVFEACARTLREHVTVHVASADERGLGRTYHVDVYPTESGLSLFLRDVTERRRAEELQEIIVGIAAHDLRSPLASISGSVDLLLKRGSLSESDTSALQRIARSGKRMGALIDQLLDFTQLRRSGGLPIQRRPMDLGAVCREVVEELRAAFPDCRIDLDIGARTTGEWDPDRMAQVVSNLVGNAILYRAPRTSVSVTVEPGGGDDVVMKIVNQGIAIPSELVPSLFEPFSRGPGKEAARRHGVGLGLYITREIVRAHGGDVEVRSSDACGTTFLVRVPRGGREPAQDTGEQS